MKGKCRIRGPSKIKHWTNSWILVSKDQFLCGIAPPYFVFIHDIRTQGKQNFGTPGKYVEPRGLWILRRWEGWSNSKKLVRDRNWSFVQHFLWGNFMWQKQDQKVELFPGKFWENIIKVSLNEDNNSRIQHSFKVFQWRPLLMQRGQPQKVVHLGCKKYFF